MAPPHRRAGWWIVAAGAVAVIVVIAVVVQVRSPSVGVAPQGTLTYPVRSSAHVQGAVTYDHAPPVGGDHSPVWLNCGVYDHAVRNENAVHALQHGAVWITYQPTLDAAGVRVLRTLVEARYDGADRYVILSPYPGQSAPVMATAWEHQLSVASASDPRLAAFIEYFREGPQDPEPGAACSGGTGIPLG